VWKRPVTVHRCRPVRVLHRVRAVAPAVSVGLFRLVPGGDRSWWPHRRRSSHR